MMLKDATLRMISVLTREMDGSGDTKMVRLAYIVNWFPSLSETFICDELRVLASLGLAIDVFPLGPADVNVAALVASGPGASSGFRVHPAQEIDALTDVIGSGPYDHIHAHYATKPATT